MSLTLKRFIFEEDKLKRIAAKKKTIDNRLKYVVARNKVNDGIKYAKTAYNDNYFGENFR